MEGGEGNSSVAELEVRVEELEGTATDHETRILTTEVDVSGSCGGYFLLSISNCPESIGEESVILNRSN